ncbi:MAG: rhomboid family intramembrane serine protease [Proteobacteria bacterium]|nr:rhomboid family intramembrane serine protease [Pseudomonadota bacterium]
MASREPIFNAPPVVVWSLGVLVAAHIALQLLSPEHWSEAVELLAVIPSRYTGAAPELAGGYVAAGTSLITHQFVHGDITHIGLNAAWLLAFGSAVASRIGTLRFLAFALLSGVAGAVTFIIAHFGANTIMVGASGALAGLMGGAFRFLFSAFDDGGPGAFRGDQTLIRRMSIGELLGDRRAQLAILFWVGLNGVTALLAPFITSAGGIAWEAHLGGFFFGLLTFGAFDVARRSRPDEQPRPTLH